MKVRFWGTRGSISSSFTAALQREKLRQALLLAQGKDTSTPEAIDAFIDNDLPFSLSGTFGTNTICVEIEYLDNEYILMDCGTGIVDFVKAFKASGKPQSGNTFHIFISHLHWDHIQGFPFFPVALPKGNRIIFHAYHRQTEVVIRSLFSPPVFPIPFDSLNPEIHFDIQRPEVPFNLGGVRVSSIVQNHAGVSYGYRVDIAKKSVIFSTDCEHPKSDKNEHHPFVRFYKNADLVIFDGMSSLAEKEQAGWGHSTYKVGVELCAWAKAKHLALFHHDPASSDEKLNSLQPLAEQYARSFQEKRSSDLPEPGYPKQISLPYDGLELEL